MDEKVNLNIPGSIQLLVGKELGGGVQIKGILGYAGLKVMSSALSNRPLVGGIVTMERKLVAIGKLWQHPTNTESRHGRVKGSAEIGTTMMKSSSLSW